MAESIAALIRLPERLKPNSLIISRITSSSVRRSVSDSIHCELGSQAGNGCSRKCFCSAPFPCVEYAGVGHASEASFELSFLVILSCQAPTR